MRKYLVDFLLTTIFKFLYDKGLSFFNKWKAKRKIKKIEKAKKDNDESTYTDTMGDV